MPFNERDRLLQFLEEKIFQPTMLKNEDEFADRSKKKILREVKKSTWKIMKEFHESCLSADDVRGMFFCQLNSDFYLHLEAQLAVLGLPKLREIKAEFLQLCRDLRVEPGRNWKVS